MQATGITIPQVEFAIDLLDRPSLDLCKVVVEWNEVCVTFLNALAKVISRSFAPALRRGCTGVLYEMNWSSVLTNV